jgi:Fe(3+) dicitrate transport protein
VNASTFCRSTVLASLLLSVSPWHAAAQSEPAAPEVAPPAPEPPAASPPVAAEEPIEITIVGTKLSQTAGSAYHLSEKQIARWKYDDITQALQAVPGVYIRGEDGQGLRPNIGMRGVNPDRSKKITLMEDGVLFGPAPYSAPAGYYFPVFQRMTDVKVIKGPGAIAYGPQTIGGALDLVTRAIPDTTSASADVAVGQYGYGKGHVWAGSSVGKFGFLIEGMRLQNNGFKELHDSAGNRADTGFVRDEWMVKANYVLHEDDLTNEFKVKLTYSDEVSNETYLGLTDEDFRHNSNQRYPVSQLDQMKNHRASIVLSHVLQKGSHLTVKTDVYRHDLQRIWRKVNGFANADLFSVLSQPNVGDNPAYVAILHGQAASSGPSQSLMIGPNDRHFISEGVQSRLNWDARTGPVSHRLEAGVRYHYDYIDRRHSQNGFLVNGDQLLPDGNPTQVTAFNKDSTHAVAMHLLYALSWRGLTITPGLRTELMRSESYDRLAVSDHHQFNYVVLPGVGAYYELLKGLGLLGGIYQGFSPPPPGQATNVKPEKSINYEAGARYTRRLMRLEGVFFYNDYKNLTDICTENGCSTAQDNMQFSAGDAKTYGVELLAQHEIPIGRFRMPVQGSYTYTQSHFGETFSSQDPIWGNVTKGDWMPYVPEHQFRGSLGLEHPRGGANLGVTYVAPMRELPGKGSLDNTLHTDTQWFFDLAGQAKIWGPLSLYCTIQNLFNQQYIVGRRPYGARPNAPRWAHVGIKASY